MHLHKHTKTSECPTVGFVFRIGRLIDSTRFTNWYIMCPTHKDSRKFTFT